MNIYEIDKAIESILADAVDEETGELLVDTEALDALQMERDTKVENLALYVKNLSAMVTSMKAEEAALAKRRKSMEAQRDRLKRYLLDVLQGEKFTTARVAVSFRRSEAVELSPEFLEWAAKMRPDLLRYKDPEPDKTAIGKALADGEEIPGAAKKVNVSLTIK